MYPYLFGNEKLPCYGILFILGVVASYLVALINIKKKKTDIAHEDLLYGSAFAIIGGIVGAKLLAYLTELDFVIYYLKIAFSLPNTSDTIEMITELIKTGFVFYGGLLGGALGYFIYAKMYKLSTVKFYDNAVVCLPLGHAFGRLGCFASGCCYGRPTNSFLGVQYKNPANPVLQKWIEENPGVKLLPTQLFEVGFNLIIFTVLLLVNRKPRKRGTKMLIYLFSYGTCRFINEMFRFDAARGFLLGLSTSQWISIGLIVFGIVYIFVTKYFQRTLEDEYPVKEENSNLQELSTVEGN